MTRAGHRARQLLKSVKRGRRKQAHFRSFIVEHAAQAMEITSGDHTASKKGKHHEAALIPGVDGFRIFGFPNSIITKMRYIDSFNVTGSLGAVASRLWSANGIFDPDLAAGGHQPMYRDNYAAIYDQYVVLGSKITVTYVPLSTTVATLCGITGDDDSSVSSNVITLQEQNNAISTISALATGPKTVLTSTFEPLREFGVDAKDDGASATAVGSNPTEQWVFNTWIASADGLSSAPCSMRVEIEYTVKFTELTTPTQN